MDPNNQPVGQTPQQPQAPTPPSPTPYPAPATPPNMQQPYAPQPVGPPPAPNAANDPGKTLAIVSIVLAFFFSLLGLILAIVAKSKSRKAGFKSTLATVSIVLNSIGLAISLVVTIFIVIMFLLAVQVRSVAANFSNAIRTEQYEQALAYTNIDASGAEGANAYFVQLKKDIGSSQREIDSTNKTDGSKVLIYEVEGGTSKYYRLDIKDGKVTNVSVSMTPITADSTVYDGSYSGN